MKFKPKSSSKCILNKKRKTVREGNKQLFAKKLAYRLSYKTICLLCKSTRFTKNPATVLTAGTYVLNSKVFFLLFLSLPGKFFVCELLGNPEKSTVLKDSL